MEEPRTCSSCAGMISSHTELTQLTAPAGKDFSQSVHDFHKAVVYGCSICVALHEMAVSSASREETRLFRETAHGETLIKNIQFTTFSDDEETEQRIQFSASAPLDVLYARIALWSPKLRFDLDVNFIVEVRSSKLRKCDLLVKT